jgi:hypothetical protein
MPIPTCPDDCDATLPVVSFDECQPEVNDGQIYKLYVTNIGNTFTDVTSLPEWTARLDNGSANADAIRTLHVIGSKPVPTSEEKDISLGRKITSKKTHSVPFKIDETNAINHEFLRLMECGGNFLFWYETSGGLLFGGNEGIKASFTLDMEIPESETDFIQLTGKADWKAKFTEERTPSPLA